MTSLKQRRLPRKVEYLYMSIKTRTVRTTTPPPRRHSAIKRNCFAYGSRTNDLVHPFRTTDNPASLNSTDNKFHSPPTANPFPIETFSTVVLLAKAMSGSNGGRETGRGDPEQAHYSQSAEQPHGVYAAGPPEQPIGRVGQVRDTREQWSTAQGQDRHAHNPGNQDQYQARQGHHAESSGSQRTSDTGRRQRRDYRLCDYRAMIDAEYRTLEMALRGSHRPRAVMEELQVDEHQEDEAEPGCLDLFGPRFKRLFHCGGRNQRQRVERQAQTRNPQEAGDQHRGTGAVVGGRVTAATSPRSAYLPKGFDRAGQGNTQVPAMSHTRPPGDEGWLPSTSDGQGAFPRNLPVANASAAPAMFPAAETAHISGGHFYVANTIVQNIYPSESSITPAFIPPRSWTEPAPGSRTVRYEVTWREIT
ncbi:hypothetical protein BKA70DRAFT_1253881 [Coprinopsis sp. MPI-PUGE-AT-0042]|nr:hypothetical protein BKA70DRAFT_1253881 [Coprinopsis sp. MPI-PUGE-AT-0042]